MACACPVPQPLQRPTVEFGSQKDLAHLVPPDVRNVEHESSDPSLEHVQPVDRTVRDHVYPEALLELLQADGCPTLRRIRFLARLRVTEIRSRHTAGRVPHASGHGINTDRGTRDVVHVPTGPERIGYELADELFLEAWDREKIAPRAAQ